MVIKCLKFGVGNVLANNSFDINYEFIVHKKKQLIFTLGTNKTNSTTHTYIFNHQPKLKKRISQLLCIKIKKETSLRSIQPPFDI